MTEQSLPDQQSLAVFEEYKQAINQALTEYCHNVSQQFAGQELPPIAAKALDLMNEYTLRPGKRVRGALAAMIYDHLTDQKLSQNGLQLAVVMELIQSYILIVDDVTDKSDLRRGEPTVHRMYERAYNGKVSEREAEQLAFYTGMITGHIAQALLSEIEEKPEHVVRVIRAVNENIVTTGFGQLDDIMQEITREATTDDIIRKYGLKTSHYTFINPLHAGMALAGITDETAYRQVAVFGVAAGVAFQTHDDYLGIFGGSETGKPNTDDIKEGKLTILTQYTIEHGSPDDVATLQKYLGSPDFDEAGLEIVRALLDHCGATMEAHQVEQQYAQEAITKLQVVTILDDTFKSLLAELVRYSINRES